MKINSDKKIAPRTKNIYVPPQQKRTSNIVKIEKYLRKAIWKSLKQSK
jgi:hypothetical protein